MAMRHGNGHCLDDATSTASRIGGGERSIACIDPGTGGSHTATATTAFGHAPRAMAVLTPHFINMLFINMRFITMPLISMVEDTRQ